MAERRGVKSVIAQDDGPGKGSSERVGRGPIPGGPPHGSVLAQLAALERMSMEDLRKRWRELTGSAPPNFNRALLVGRLAYQIQAVAFGGLKPATVARLDALARQIDRGGKGAGKGRFLRAAKDRPVAGTRLIREWQGVHHSVTVREDGYEYQGRPFKSLSAVARAIAGTRWNGWAFFGLRAPLGGSEIAP